MSRPPRAVDRSGSETASDAHGVEECPQQCWCGNRHLLPYVGAYALCEACGTLVCQVSHDGLAGVTDEASDYYGPKYWTTHQQGLGLPSVEERSRFDLTERALHWLRQVLLRRRPPSRLLEIGCGHGGFAFLCQLVGFDTSALELSREVARSAAQRFGIEVVAGKLSEQGWTSRSFDVVALLDVLEHSPTPASLLQGIEGLVGERGILMLQTPCFPSDLPRREVIAESSPFRAMMIPREHLFLFSRAALGEILQQSGFEALQFCEPAFPYDSFVLAARRAEDLTPTSAEALTSELLRTPQGRTASLLLDLQQQKADLQRQLDAAEEDRAARLEAMQRLGAWLEESEAARLQQEPRLDEFMLRPVGERGDGN